MSSSLVNDLADALEETVITDPNAKNKSLNVVVPEDISESDDESKMPDYADKTPDIPEAKKPDDMVIKNDNNLIKQGTTPDIDYLEKIEKKIGDDEMEVDDESESDSSENEAEEEPKNEAGDKQVSVGNRKPFRFRPGTVALREIRKYQKTTNLLIPSLPFERLVREIANEYRNDLRFSEEALKALQCASEIHMTELFENANLISCSRDSSTIKLEDLQLAYRLSNF